MINTKQKGFTLVEIAIVLVIIGLLLGGILKGQELINSARVRNLADQNSGTQAAYYGFIDRYRAVPGDMLVANACNAIGQSNLTGVDCTANAAANQWGGNGNGALDVENYFEAGALWFQLAGAGFIAGGFTGAADNTDAAYLAGSVAPLNAFNGRVMLTRTDNYMPAGGSDRLSFVFGASIPVNIMRELDVKIDDSLPTSGVLRHTNPAAAEVYLTTAGCVDETVDPDIWNIDGAEPLCNGIFIY